MQKPLSAVLFLAVIFMPYAPLVSFPARVEAAVGDVTYFDNPGSNLWTVPAGVTAVKVKVWGAGAAAGLGEKIANQNRASLGGGAGGYTEQTLTVTPGQTYLVDVGAGGQGINMNAGRVGNPGGESKFEGNGVNLRATGGSGGATAVGFGNPMDPVGFGGIGDGGNDAINQAGGDSAHATWDGDNWDSSSGGSAYNGGQGGSRGRLGRDGQGHCNGYTEAYTGGPLVIPCSSTDAWAKDGGFPGGGGGGSDTGLGGFGANGRVSIEEVVPPNPMPSGYIDGSSCSNVNGWAYDTTDSSASINIHFYHDGPAGSGTFFGSILASDPRPDLNNIGIPGNHGYTFNIPDSLKDGGTHTIYAYGIDLDTSIHYNNAALISTVNNANDFVTISGCTTTQPPQPPQPPVDNAPTAPSISGPTTGTANASYSFTATATDPENGQVRYGFDWDNNASIDEFTGFVASGAGASLSHTWTTAATYTFQVYALDGAGNQSGATAHSIVISPASVTPGISSVSIAVTPNPVVIPNGGSVQLVVDSTAAVTGFASLTQHGIEVSTDGGASWVNAGAWTIAQANVARTSDASFTALNLTTAGTYQFRTYGSIDNGVSYTYSNPVSVTATVTAPPVSTLDSVSISVTPNPVVIPMGGNVQLVITSTATVTGGAALTQHGTEVSLNGGAYVNSGAWPAPVSNTLRTSDASFTALNLTTAGSYAFRTYASIDGVNYVYSTPVTVPVTISTNNAPVVSGVVGPTTGLVNTSYLFTATATDADGDNIEYGFDWNNNGTIDTTLGESWAPAVASGTPVGRSNIWTINGVQSFQVLVRDALGASSSFPVSITISGGSSNIGFTLATSTGGFSTSEVGSTAVMTVVLNSAPLASVTVPVTSSDFTEGTTSVTSLLFTTGNWNVPQTVTITGVDDLLADGDISYNVTTGPSTSSDVNYNNLPGQSLALVNFDNELSPGVGGSVSSFSINPTVITSGNVATLSWTASNATLCVASGSWTGNQNVTSGSVNVGPYTTASTITNTYTLTCGNSNGTTTQSVTLTIDPTSGGGGSSGGSGGSGGGHGGVCIGFGCPTTGTSTPVYDPLIFIDTSSGGGSSTPTPAKACASTDFITTYLRLGIENNPNEVKKLQYFLNTYDNATLELSGIFDVATEDAVKAFQARHADEVLLPWGADVVPTGIVYITTTAAINRIFCGDNPNYTGDDYLKDILNPVLNVPPTDNSSQFEGVIGSATTSTSTNLAGVFGAITGDILKLIKDIPWYELLLLLLILLGSGFIVQSIFKKDITSQDNAATLAEGATLLAIASVLNVLNTLSFMMRPEWFKTAIGMNPSWLLGLDTINLLATVVICLSLLIVIHRKVLASEIK